jgi:hypothetical protein
MRRLLFRAVVLLAGVLAASAVDALELRLITRAPEPVFVWARDRCETWNIPDAPARAYRTTDGSVRLVAAHHRNRFMHGADLDRLRIDCDIVFRGAEDDRPEAYDDKLWLSAVWTEDGDLVHALAHAEFHGQRRPRSCPAAQYMACWRNQLVHVVSRDGGRSFAREGIALVAGVPYRYDGEAGRRSGYFEPSNVFRFQGALHAFVWAEGYEAQRRGACLLRTTDIADPRAWRAWDGQRFAVAFVDPYRERVDDPARHVCAPIRGLDGVVQSVVRHVSSGRYLAIFATVRAAAPGAKRQSGVWYASSTDLVTWSTPRLLMEVPLMWALACPQPTAWAYPALIDHRSTARNFDEVGARAELYLTRFNLASDCRLGPDRDLVRFGVEIQG